MKPITYKVKYVSMPAIIFIDRPPREDELAKLVEVEGIVVDVRDDDILVEYDDSNGGTELHWYHAPKEAEEFTKRLENYKAAAQYLIHENEFGPLHIIISDGNCEDSNIDFCIKYCEENNHADSLFAVKVLLRFEVYERKIILRILDKYRSTKGLTTDFIIQ